MDDCPNEFGEYEQIDDKGETYNKNSSIKSVKTKAEQIKRAVAFVKGKF